MFLWAFHGETGDLLAILICIDLLTEALVGMEPCIHVSLGLGRDVPF